MIVRAMLEIGPQNKVTALTEIYAKASTSPCRVETQSGGDWVMKFRGAGPGPIGLLTEFVALRVARGMRLPVPNVRPLYLPPGFPWTLGSDEFDGIVQRSFGWNLGIEFVEGAVPASAEQVSAAGEDFLGKLAQVDRALANTDRSARNTNILSSHDGLVAIDFDACLFLRRAIRNIVPTEFPLWHEHLLIGRTFEMPRKSIPGGALSQAIDEAPGEWIDATGLNAAALKSRLQYYADAWEQFG